MIRIAIIGDIGSGKSYVANNFGYPVFNADSEVSNIYKKNKKVFNKLKKKLPKYISKFPIDKNEITAAILSNKNNLKKIIKIVHLEVQKNMQLFLKKNIKKKIVILDIPLLLENKINKKKDILIFVDSEKTKVEKRLRRRVNFNYKLLNKFRKIQLPIDYKKKKANFIIKNDFRKKTINIRIKKILKQIINERSST